MNPSTHPDAFAQYAAIDLDRGRFPRQRSGKRREARPSWTMIGRVPVFGRRSIAGDLMGALRHDASAATPESRILGTGRGACRAAYAAIGQWPWPRGMAKEVDGRGHVFGGHPGARRSSTPRGGCSRNDSVRRAPSSSTPSCFGYDVGGGADSCRALRGYFRGEEKKRYKLHADFCMRFGPLRLAVEPDSPGLRSGAALFIALGPM